LVSRLLDKGAEIDAKGNDGYTSLHLAAKYGHLNVVKKLSDNGAKIYVKNNDGFTPLGLAKEYNKLKVISFFRKKQQKRPVQRKRRHHSGEQRYMSSAHFELEGTDRSVENNNPAIENNQATSGASKVSSWINDLCGWVKEKSEVVVSNVINGLCGDSTKELEGYKSGNIQTGSKKSEKTSSATLLNISHFGKSPVQGISKENVSNKGLSSSWRKVEGSTNFGAALPKGASSTASSISQVYAQPDITGLMLLVPIFMNTMGRKFVLPLLSADHPISPEKAQGYALNITEEFEKVVEQAGLKKWCVNASVKY
jgi:FOG: Ankyrin repeat